MKNEGKESDTVSVIARVGALPRNTGQEDPGFGPPTVPESKTPLFATDAPGSLEWFVERLRGRGTINDWRQSLESGARRPNCCAGKFGKRAKKEVFDREDTR